MSRKIIALIRLYKTLIGKKNLTNPLQSIQQPKDEELEV